MRSNNKQIKLRLIGDKYGDLQIHLNQYLVCSMKKTHEKQKYLCTAWTKSQQVDGDVSAQRWFWRQFPPKSKQLSFPATHFSMPLILSVTASFSGRFPLYLPAGVAAADQIKRKVPEQIPERAAGGGGETGSVSVCEWLCPPRRPPAVQMQFF